MRFFLLSWMLNIKKITGKKSVLLVMCLLPAALLALALPMSRAGAGVLARVSVGLCYNAADEASQQVYRRMAGAKGIELVSFGVAEAAGMERMVVLGELECGYVLDAELSARIKSDDMEGVVTLVKTRAAVADAVVNEMVYAALIAAASPHITAKTLEEGMGADYAGVIGTVAESVARHQAQDIFVSPEYSYENGGQVEGPRDGSRFHSRVLRGVTALFALMAVLLICPVFIAEKRRRAFVTMASGRLRWYYASVFAAIFTLNLFFAMAALFITRGAYPAAMPGPLWAALGLGLYVAAVSMLGVFLICLLNDSELITGGFVFIVLLNLLFGGVLLDLGELSPLLGALSRFFISNYYLNGGVGGLAALALVTTVFAAGSALALLARKNY